MKVNRMTCRDVVKALELAAANGDSTSKRVGELRARLAPAKGENHDLKNLYKKCRVCAQDESCREFLRG